MVALAFLNFGFTEILLVGVVALLVFGGDLPDVMRSVGRSYARLRRSLQELSRPVRDEIGKIRDLPPVGPPASNPPVPEYPEYGDPDVAPPAEPEPEPMPDDAAQPRRTPSSDETSAGGVADEPPPV